MLHLIKLILHAGMQGATCHVSVDSGCKLGACVRLVSRGGLEYSMTGEDEDKAYAQNHS